MSKPIEVHDTHSTDCVYGDGNGLLHLDEESFDRVMKEVYE